MDDLVREESLQVGSMGRALAGSMGEPQKAKQHN